MNPNKTKKMNISHGKHQIVQQHYKGDYTKQEIKEYAQKLSNSLKDDGFNGEISVALKMDEGWRAGYLRAVGENVEMYQHTDSGDDINEQDKFTEFTIMIKKNNPKKGGDDKFNDCLFKCLNEVLEDRNPFKTGKKLKDYLGLKRTEMVDISLIPKIEDKLSLYKINVTGDHTYTSTKNVIMEINLILSNCHYTLNKHTLTKTKGISPKEKQPLVYSISKTNKNEVDVFDGKEERTITYDEYKQIRNNPISSKYVLVPPNEKRESQLTMKQRYDKFTEEAEDLKKATNGVINLYKTGSYQTTALKLFNDFTKTIKADDILDDEAEWIEKASCGAIIFAEHYKGEGYKYDVTSEYPYLMSKQTSLYPVSRGTFKQITNEEFNKLFLTYGLYRCVIKNTSKKQFRENFNNIYTHFDIRRAKEKGYDVKLIIDDKPNALLYERSKCLNGNIIFRQYVDFLFPLKQNKVKGAKMILNILWGLLCKKNVLKLKACQGTLLEVYADNKIQKITPIGDIENENYSVKVCKYGVKFENNFARISPFLLAKGRYMISKLIEPYENMIVRSHTDSMISKKPLPVQIGDSLGDLKYEGYCKNLEIINSAKIIGEFVL